MGGITHNYLTLATRKKTVPLVNKNTDELSQHNNLEKHSSLLFRNKVPHIRVLYPGDHQTDKFVILKSDCNKVRDLDGPAISSYKAEPSFRPSETGKVTSPFQGRKLNRATVTTAHDPGPCSEVTTIKSKSPILNSVARDQAWKRLNSDHQDKHNVDSNEQAKLKVGSQHQANVQLSPEDQSTHLLNGYQKIPALGPERKAEKQLNPRSWAEFSHGCDHQAMIPLSRQRQAQVALDLVSEDLLPLNQTHVKSEGPIHMSIICGCPRKSQSFIFQQATIPPCCVCSSRPQLLKTLSSSDCWTTVPLPVLEPHSKAPLHPSVQDISVPKKSALLLTEAPKSQYNQAKATQISEYRNKEHHQIQPEQNRGKSRGLHDIKPYITEEQTHTTKFVDDVINSIPKEKIKSDYSNQVHLRQMKECPTHTHWPSQHMSANDNSYLVCSSWTPNTSPHVDRSITIPTSFPCQEKKNVRFFLDVPQSKTSPSSKTPCARSSKLKPVYPSPAFSSCSHSDPVCLAPLRPRLTWLDFIRCKYQQPKDEITSPLFWGEIPLTSKNFMKEMSMRQNTWPISLLKKFENRINN